MLQKQTVSGQLLELIRWLMNEETCKNLYLVGGTSLALREGHRKSVDIDLFGSQKQWDELLQMLREHAPQVALLNERKQILSCLVEGIKIDFVNYPYKWLKPYTEIEGLRLASLEDIAAMKMNAIIGRGSKKDFIDIYFLFKHFTLVEMINFFSQKYPEGSKLLLLKSLSYFEDAEIEPMPEMLKQVAWSTIKKRIVKEIGVIS